MATTAPRPWEMNSSSPRPQGGAQLPSISALTNGLPDAGQHSGLSSPISTRERDSGAWSQPQSTRTSLRSAHGGESTDDPGSSTYSTNTSSYPMSSATNSYYMSPNRMSNLSNHSGHGPTSHVSADYGPVSSPSFGAAGTHHSGPLPSIDQHHAAHHTDPNRQSIASQGSEGGFPPQESRRSSLGSQVNQGMTSLQINGGGGAPSPYNSVNHSSASLAQNLSRERGIPPTAGLRASARSSGPLPPSPLSPGAQAAESRTQAGYARIAPPITNNPRSDVYNAADPVPGQAYAFPDAGDMEPGALPPKSANTRHLQSSDGNRPPAPIGQRRDSGHTSIASNTASERLPPGQHRLDESVPSTPQHHHHSLQSRGTISEYGDDDDEAMTPEASSQPYSRTPALRVSHKMAERKRRSEMKDLFENLRSQIPSNQGSKSSKWEILTKASEYIKQLESMNQSAHQADKQLRLAMHDVDLTRREMEKLRNENQRLMQEMQRVSQGSPVVGAPPPAPSQAPPPPPGGMQPGAMHPAHYVPPPPPPNPMHDPSRSLPPLGPSAQNSNQGGSSMQGVQYTHEQR